MDKSGGNQIPVVIIAEDGRTLALDINLTVPLSFLSPAIEKHFKVAAASQVLKYNGDPLGLTESLKTAGALLLPGEPYVKLHLQTAKGNRTALVGLLPTGKELPLSVPEDTTFKAIKKMFLDREPSIGATTKDVRLYFRYNELVDQASPRHFRLPNNAKIDIVKKLNFDTDSKRHKKATPSGEDQDAKLREFRIRKENAKKDAVASISNSKPQPTRVGARSATRTSSASAPSSAATSTSPTPISRTAARSTTTTTTTTKVSAHGTAAADRPQSAAAVRRTTPTAVATHANLSRPSSGAGAGSGRLSTTSLTRSSIVSPSKGTPSSVHTKNNRVKAFYEEGRSDGSDGSDEEEDADAEKRRLRLMSGAAANIAGGNRGGRSGATESQVLHLRKQLHESDIKYQDAMDRIAELERTVQRYQVLCTKMTSSCPPEFFANIPSPMKQPQFHQ